MTLVVTRTICTVRRIAIAEKGIELVLLAASQIDDWHRLQTCAIREPYDTTVDTI